jgi:hypothetical protein
MKYKVGDWVVFNQDCRLAFGSYIPKGNTGKITDIVDTGLTIAYRIKMKDFPNATVPTEKVDDCCEKINAAPSITKRINDKSDAINGLANTDAIKPNYYQFHGYDVFDIADYFELDFALGNALKYILRHKDETKRLEDLKKGRQCLDRAIELMEGKEDGRK